MSKLEFMILVVVMFALGAFLGFLAGWLTGAVSEQNRLLHEWRELRAFQDVISEQYRRSMADGGEVN